jgi:hypothetical protein
MIAPINLLAFKSMSTTPIPKGININNAMSVAYWLKELNCTEAQLIVAVTLVGTQAADVRRQLRLNQ